MSYFPGDSEMKSILVDLLRNTSHTSGKRRALIRLLWHDAAGDIISQHVTIRKCYENGRIAVEVDDSRWIQTIRDAAKLILQRINTALGRMNLHEYMVNGLDIFPAPTVPPGRRKPSKKTVPPPVIPDHIEQKIADLPEGMQKNFRQWYLAAQTAQETESDPEN